METERLLPASEVTNIQNDAGITVYRRRWYVLTVFSLVCFMQCFQWNTWGPITDSCQAAYGWSNAEVALLANWGPITFIPTMPLFSYLIDSKGLRVGVLVAAALTFFGAAFRCISVSTAYGFVLINIGQLLNGLAGPVCMSAPAVVSSVWFPGNERTTSTSVGGNAANLGIALSFLTAFLIPSSQVRSSDASKHGVVNITANVTELVNLTDAVPVKRITHAINLLMYAEAAVSGCLFVLILVYFPAAPPTPPALSASKGRKPYLQSIKQLFSSWPLWMVALSYGLAGGTFNAWSGVADDDLKPVGISQRTVGWIGFTSQLAGLLFSVIASRLADAVFRGKYKQFILALALGSSAFSIWFVLIMIKVLPVTKVSVYTSVIGLSIFVNSAIPSYYEVAIETCYPVSESVISGFMAWLNNVFEAVFLLLPYIPAFETVWLNWAILLGQLVVLPLMLIYPPTYRRQHADSSLSDLSQSQSNGMVHTPE